MNDELKITVSRASCRLLAQLLRMANEEFGNHGCNDFELLDAFGGDEAAARHFAIGYHAHNLNKTRETLVIGEKAETHFDPDMYDVFEADLLTIPDFDLFSYFAARFETIAESESK